MIGRCQVGKSIRGANERTLAVSKNPAAWHFPERQVPPKPVRHYDINKIFRLDQVTTRTTRRSVDKQGIQLNTFLWVSRILTYNLTCLIVMVGAGCFKSQRSPDSLALYWPWVRRVKVSIISWWLDRSRDDSQATDVHWPLAHANPLPQLSP